MVMRVSGFASGMDIDSIVSDMLKAQRAPLNKLLQKKQILEWQRDDYRAMNTALLNFRTNELTSMRLTTNYRTKNVSSSDESKVTATATSGANQASYSISKVSQLASAEVWVNAGSVTKSGEILDTTKSLYSEEGKLQKGITWKEGAVLTETFKAENTGKEFTIKDAANVKTDHLASWSVKVDGKSYQVVTNSADLTKGKVLVDSNGKLTFNDDIAADSEIKVDYIGKVKSERVNISPSGTVNLSQVGLSMSGGNTAIKLITTNKTTQKVEESYYSLSATGEIKDEAKNLVIGNINKETGLISFTKDAPKSDDNLSYNMEVSYSHKYTNISLISNTSSGKQYEKILISGADSINSAVRKVNDSKVGVSMFYDSSRNQMTLTRTETGRFSTDKDANDLEIYGSLLNDTFRFGESNVNPIVGQNAIFTINGLETERNSNTFTIDGVTFNLKQTFEATDSPVTIGVSNDNNKIYDNIKGFIDKYNELISTISAKTSETRNKDYQPLTDEERESLSDTQQEKWDEIAKTGLLRRDSILTGVLSQMRTDFYSTVSNSEISSSYNQLAKIGITTSANYLDGGKLVIDEAKLKAAIEADPNSVEQLFRGENGIIEKLTDTVNGAMDKLKEKAGNSFSTNDNFTIGKELNNIADRQDRFEDRLEQLETRYWAQFTAMEQAIQRSNEQSASLAQFFS